MTSEHAYGHTGDPDGLLEVESDRAYVVYDAESGTIVHVHGSTTFRGAEGRSEQEDEERALEVAREMGARGDLAVLAVDPAEVNATTPLRVDTDGPRLESAPPASG